MILDRDNPSRADWYQMQTAAEVRVTRLSFMEKPPSVSMDDFKLQWKNEPQHHEHRARIVHETGAVADNGNNDSDSDIDQKHTGWRRSRAMMASLLKVKIDKEN